MKNIIFIASLLVTITLGTVLSVGQKPAVPNTTATVPVKVSNPVKSEQIELVVRHNPVGNGQYGHVTLKGASDGDMVKFKVRPKPLTQDVFGNVLIFSGTEKSYEVEVDVITWETKNWRTADAVVNFGQLPLPPPKPDDPVVPEDDQFTKDIKAAFNYSNEVDKLKLIGSLGDVLGGIIPAAKASGKITTTTQLHNTVRTASDLAIGAGKLDSIRTIVGKYLESKLGTGDKVIDNAFWSTASVEYAYVSKVLKGVK